MFIILHILAFLATANGEGKGLSAAELSLLIVFQIYGWIVVHNYYNYLLPGGHRGDREVYQMAGVSMVQPNSYNPGPYNIIYYSS